MILSLKYYSFKIVLNYYFETDLNIGIIKSKQKKINIHKCYFPCFHFLLKGSP